MKILVTVRDTVLFFRDKRCAQNEDKMFITEGI
jgi:hypothetical protein